MYYKITTANGGAFSGGKGKWDLPKHGKPGKWRIIKGPLQSCSNGLHVCSKDQLIEWIDIWAYSTSDFKIWECEIDGSEILSSFSKSVVRRARLVKDVTKQATAYLKAAHPDEETQYELENLSTSINDTNYLLADYKADEKDALENLKSVREDIKRFTKEKNRLLKKKKALQAKKGKVVSESQIAKLKASF